MKKPYLSVSNKEECEKCLVLKISISITNVRMFKENFTTYVRSNNSLKSNWEKSRRISTPFKAIL